MKTASTILALAGTCIAAAADYADFEVPSLRVNMPNGERFNYYWIDFNVTTQSGASPATSWCYSWWGDSPDSVPANEWIACTTEPGGEVASDISYQIYTKPFYVGDFSFGVRQNFTETSDDDTTTQMILTSSPYHLSNTSSTAYNCTIEPYDNGYQIHAGGRCGITAPISLPVADASPACTHAKTVSLSFPIEVRTEYGDNIFVVGSIPELGNWDLSRAVPLNADEYTTTQPNHMVWNGGNVEVAAGTTFEWKAVQRNADGSWLWDCGSNQIFTVDEFTCGKQSVSKYPVWFACGNH